MSEKSCDNCLYRNDCAAIHTCAPGWNGWTPNYETLSAKVKTLEDENRMMLETIKFYADKDNWWSRGRLHRTQIIDNDSEVFSVYNVGGKRSRECLKKLDNKVVG